VSIRYEAWLYTSQDGRGSLVIYTAHSAITSNGPDHVVDPDESSVGAWECPTDRDAADKFLPGQGWVRVSDWQPMGQPGWWAVVERRAG
jgi:hypothetical protein